MLHPALRHRGPGQRATHTEWGAERALSVKVVIVSNKFNYNGHAHVSADTRVCTRSVNVP